MKRTTLLGFLGSTFFHGIIFLGIWLILIHNRGSHGFKAPIVATHISMQMFQGMITEESQSIGTRQTEIENKIEVSDPTVKSQLTMQKEKKSNKETTSQKPLLTEMNKTKQIPPERIEDMVKGKVRVNSQAKTTSQATSNSKSKGHDPKLVGNGPQLNEIIAYENALRAEIEKQKHYPLRAKMMYKQGTVKIKFMLRLSGELYNIQIEKSSGNSDLDQAALQAAQRVKPIGIKPEGVSDVFVVPIHFIIN